MSFHDLGKLFVAFTGLVKARRNTKDMETPDLVYAAGLGEGYGRLHGVLWIFLEIYGSENVFVPGPGSFRYEKHGALVAHSFLVVVWFSDPRVTGV